MEELGKIAYDAYKEKAFEVSVQGEPRFAGGVGPGTSIKAGMQPRTQFWFMTLNSANQRTSQANASAEEEASKPYRYGNWPWRRSALHQDH
jgi:hypothetical protein